MAKPVLFRHPAPVRFVPARGRHVRRAFAEVDTPVMLTDITTAEMPEAGRDDWGSFCFHDGQLWRASMQMDSIKAMTDLSEAAFPSSWKAYEQFRVDAPFLVARSPIMASVPRCMKSWHAVPVGDRHTVVHDGTDRARLDLAEYLDGNVRLVDGRPFFRIRGPLIRLGFGNGPYVGTHAAWDYDPAGNVATAPRLELAYGLVAEGVADRIRKALAADSKATGKLPPLTDVKDDVLHFLNTVGETLMEINWGTALREDPEGYARPMHDAVVRRMTPWAELGMLGSVRLDDAGAVIEDARCSCWATIEGIEEEGFHAPEIVQRLLDFIEDYVEPSLDADMAPDDEAELDALVGPIP